MAGKCSVGIGIALNVDCITKEQKYKGLSANFSEEELA
jgi:hypothetical protein